MCPVSPAVSQPLIEQRHNTKQPLAHTILLQRLYGTILGTVHLHNYLFSGLKCDLIKLTFLIY